MLMTFCECGNVINANDGKEWGGIDDKYLIIYECNKCNKRNFVNSKNSKNVDGAIVLAILDFDNFDVKSRNQALKDYGF